MQALTDALTKSGLPGKEISSVVQPHALGTLTTYTVSRTQVEMLGLAGLADHLSGPESRLTAPLP
jgi:hypothetical protein